MELGDYTHILRRRGWIILLVAVLTAAAAFAFSRLQTPIYKSSVDILIQPARPDFGLTQSAKILLRSYASWMNTDARAKDVIDQLQLDRTPGDLRSDVTIASDDSRLIIQITVEDPDGDLGNDIARIWRDLFIQWRDEENSQLNKEDQMKAIQLDEPVYGLARPKWKINVLAGAILGALVGGVVIFVLEWIESGVVRRPEDIDRYLGLPLLGTIPSARIDTSRPYLLSGQPGEPTTPPRPAPVAQAPATPPTPPPQPVAQPAVQALPAHPPVQAPAQAPSPADDPPPAPEQPNEAPSPPLPTEEAGPIEPTFLHTKGDAL